MGTRLPACASSCTPLTVSSPPPAPLQAKRVLKGRTPAQLAAQLEEAQLGWSAWAVGVHWLVMAAEAAGLRDFGELDRRFAAVSRRPPPR